MSFIGEVVLLCSSVGCSIHKKMENAVMNTLNEQFGDVSQIYRVQI